MKFFKLYLMNLPYPACPVSFTTAIAQIRRTCREEFVKAISEVERLYDEASSQGLVIERDGNYDDLLKGIRGIYEKICEEEEKKRSKIKSVCDGCKHQFYRTFFDWEQWQCLIDPLKEFRKEKRIVTSCTRREKE